MAQERLVKEMGGVPLPLNGYLLSGTGTGATDYGWNIQISYLLDRTNHTGGQDASTITSGIFDLARIPAAAVAKMVIVVDQTARFALTTAQVQNGDTVLQQSGTPNNQMFYVVDDTNLDNASGYQIYTATASWTTVTGKPQNIVDIAAITGLAEGDVLQYISGAIVKRTTSQLKDSLQIKEDDALVSTVSSLSSTAGVITVDLSTKTPVLDILLTEDVTSWNFTNLPAAGTCVRRTIRLKQDSSVARTCVSPATAGNTAMFPWVVSTDLGAVEFLSLIIFSDGTVTLFPSGVLV